MENPETVLHFDAENPTTPEEILKTKMEEALIKRTGVQNPFNDHLESALADKDEIYLNDKEQLIRIVEQVTQSGKVKQLHNILSFDVSKLPQANQHKYIGDQDGMVGIGRAKVPVKDGVS